MKTPWLPLLVALAVALVQPADIRAEDFVTNRLTFSARLGFNISARFKGNAANLPTPTSTRTTPRGDRYNYDDGYVLTDISGNRGGQTWYWGYDNSASQISGDSILLSRSTSPSSDSPSRSFDDDPHVGAELTYDRYLGTMGKFRFGVEAAANYLDISLRDSSRLSRDGVRVTDAYPFTPGTTPPAGPYQGSFAGPGFVISATPINSTTTFVPDAVTVSGKRRFEGNLWGGRLGPYIDFPIGGNDKPMDLRGPCRGLVRQ